MRPFRDRVLPLVVPISIALLSTSLTACGDNAAMPDDGAVVPGDVAMVPDDAAITPEKEARIVVTTENVKPALFVLRDGLDGHWQSPTAVRDGYYELTVHGPYTVVVVCVDGEAVQTREFFLTPEDPRDLEILCIGTPPPTSEVTGTMHQQGAVALGVERVDGNTNDWRFNIPVEDGIHDLVARASLDSRLVIRRDIVVAGSTQVSPAIDVAAEGIQLVEYPATITNVRPDETSFWEHQLITRSTRFPFFVENMPKVLPDSAFLTTDAQRVRLLASSSRELPPGLLNETRAITHWVVAGDSPVLALPPSIAAVQVAMADQQLTLTWDAIPRLTNDVFEIIGFGADTTYTDEQSPRKHYSTVSISYIRSTGSDKAALHTDIPSYEPTWKMDLSKDYDSVVLASNWSIPGQDFAYSIVTKSVNASSQEIARRVDPRAIHAKLAASAERGVSLTKQRATPLAATQRQAP